MLICKECLIYAHISDNVCDRCGGELADADSLPAPIVGKGKQTVVALIAHCQNIIIYPAMFFESMEQGQRYMTEVVGATLVRQDTIFKQADYLPDCKGILLNNEMYSVRHLEEEQWSDKIFRSYYEGCGDATLFVLAEWPVETPLFKFSLD